MMIILQSQVEELLKRDVMGQNFGEGAIVMKNVNGAIVKTMPTELQDNRYSLIIVYLKFV